MAEEITSTTVIVPGRSPISGIPGDRDEAYVRSVYGSDLNLNGLEATSRTDAGIRYIEFRPKSGTKG